MEKNATIFKIQIQTRDLRQKCLYSILIPDQSLFQHAIVTWLKNKFWNGLLVEGLFWLEIHKNVKNLHSIYAWNFVKGNADKIKIFH